ncbi:MAG: RNA polymerase sigma factor [Phycisphaerales bacterium]
MTRTQITILSELYVLDAQSGNRQALTQLVEIWTPPLKSRAFQLTRNQDAASEVLQESWIAIAKGLRSLRDPSRFGPWALRIVHNKAADWVNEQSRIRAQQTNLRTNHEAHADNEHPERSNQIRTAISTLDPKLREVVFLFYMDHCTIEQLAQVLNIPVGTAKTRLRKARSLLKPLLERSTQ